MEWKLGQRFQLRLQVSTMIRILSLKKTLILKIQRPRRQPCDGGRERRWGTCNGSWKYHERPQSFQVEYKCLIFELPLQLKFSLSAGSSSPQTSSTSCWPSDPRGCSGTPSLLSTTSTTLPPAGRSHPFFIWNAALECIDHAEAKHGCR